MKKLILWVMQTRLYRYVMRKVVWRIRLTTGQTRFNGSQFQKLNEVALPGRFLLTVDEKKLTTFLIPGQMSHAAWIGRDSVWDMVNSGLRRSTLFDQAKESDRIVVMDCLNWDSEYKRLMLNYQEHLTAKPIRYDISFKLGVEELYCSELIYKLDCQQRLNCDLSDLAGIGRPYISPDGLLFAEHAVCVWDSDGKWTNVTGPDIEAQLMNEKLR